VTLIFNAAAFARDGEGLTGTAPGPDFSVLGPSGEFKGEGPSSDPGEGVELSNPGKVGSCDLLDWSRIYFPLRDFTRCN